jgi:hypothetical protein
LKKVQKTAEQTLKNRKNPLKEKASYEELDNVVLPREDFVNLKEGSQ